MGYYECQTVAHSAGNHDSRSRGHQFKFLILPPLGAKTKKHKDIIPNLFCNQKEFGNFPIKTVKSKIELSL